MNDRLMFRAWDGEYMISHEHLVEYSLHEIVGGVLCDTPTENEQTEIAVMQSTGLRDKNGELIFEGDLLSSYSGCHEVKFGECMVNSCEYSVYGYYVDNEDKEILHADSEAEVVGNIHANPELFENKT